jgi:hypothetical protein
MAKSQDNGRTLFDGGASSVLFTERRDFYISPNMFAELWTDAAPFLTAVTQWDQRTNLKDPMFKMLA